MNKSVSILVILIILVNIIIGGWYILHGSIIFHTDISRDFLLVEDIVKNKPITLIGAKAGGIPGVFHGPLWLYVNVPAFILGNGNPAVVGGFWMILSLLNLTIVYFIALKLFKDKRISLLAVLLISAATILDTRSLYNPWGAVMLAPLFFYLYWRYNENAKLKYLLGSLFLLGLIVQFQMAFGIPLVLLTLFHVLIMIRKNKKYVHILAFLILLIPLSTFILFDLRHEFLQTKSVIDFLSGKENFGKVNLSFDALFDDRLKRILTEDLGFITFNKWFILIPLIFLLGKAGERIFNSNNTRQKDIYILFLYFYLGFWTISLFFKGQIWGYYHWPFLSLLVIFFVSLIKYTDKRLFYFLFASAVILNMMNGIKNGVKSGKFINEDGGSWKFYDRMSRDIYTDAKEDFGYYIFSGDMYGYTQRYAIHYKQNEFKDFKSHSFEKRRLTYLIIAPTDNPFLSINGWKAGQVRITKKPLKVINYNNGIYVEKYELTPEELKITSDPNMIGATLIFR